MKEGERPDPLDPAPDSRQLHPLPKGVVELYGLLAVLFVLVPEWMAAGAMRGFGDGRGSSELPLRTKAWQRIPELRLATLSMAELRLLARQRWIWGYASLNRERLSARLLKRLKRQADMAKML